MFSNRDYTTKVSLNSAHEQALLLSMSVGGVSRGPFIMAAKRASYITFKLKVVEDRAAAAMEYRVKEKQVRDWRQENDTLIIECDLYSEITWIFFCIKKGVRLTLL